MRRALEAFYAVAQPQHTQRLGLRYINLIDPELLNNVSVPVRAEFPGLLPQQKAFAMRPSTLTNALDRLESRRFLVRRSDPKDRRTFVLELTAAGGRAAADVVSLVDALERRVGERVSARQLASFHAVIAALEGALDNRA